MRKAWKTLYLESFQAFFNFAFPLKSFAQSADRNVGYFSIFLDWRGGVSRANTFHDISGAFIDLLGGVYVARGTRF